MALVVKHRKLHGDHRLVDVKDDNFKITYKGDTRLRLRFRDHVKGAIWQSARDDYGCGVGGFYLLQFTKENAIVLLKFGIENDFRFSPRALAKLDEISRS